MTEDRLELERIGTVRSTLRDLADAPQQGDEGAPEAWLVFDQRVAGALAGLGEGDRVIVVTWLHRGDRSVLQVHPRSDASRPLTGVFATRSPDRPNPLGLHVVEIAEIDGLRVRVDRLEAIDGTPIVDLKPVLSEDAAER